MTSSGSPTAARTGGTTRCATPRYGLYRTGPATATITEGGAFVSDPEVRSPDLQLHFLPACVVWRDGSHTAEKIPGHGVTMLACNVRPRSTGVGAHHQS